MPKQQEVKTARKNSSKQSATAKATRVKAASPKSTPAKSRTTKIASAKSTTANGTKVRGVAAKGARVSSATAQSATAKNSTRQSAKATKDKKVRVRGGSQVLPTSGYRGISRVDHLKRNCHGWYVRVRFKGENYSKFFSDSVHGGQDKGLHKAVRYRNKLERDIGKPRTDRTLIVVPTRNDTGVIGVKRILKEGAPVFEVTWCPEPNVLKRTSVSIRKYGEDEAFRRACAIRLKQERKLYGGNIQDAA